MTSPRNSAFLLHHEGGEVELTLGHQPCLLGQLVMGETEVESSQVRVGEQLLHQVGGAGAVRADADGGPAQIRHVAKSAAGPAEQQQRLRLGQPAEQFEPRAGRHRRAVLNQGEHFGAASSAGGEAVDILDRACGRDRCEAPVLACGALGETAGQRMILAAGGAGQHRRLQVAVIARDPERRRQRRDQRTDDEQERNARQRLAAPGARRTCKRVCRIHRLLPPTMIA